MRRPRATIRQVAEAAGVHASTVSRALNPETRTMVSEEVVRRIERVALDLGYQPHGMAAGLRRQRSMAVGVILPDITNPVFPPILRGIEDTLSSVGFFSIVANAGDDPERHLAILDQMLARRVDGLILATARRRDAVVERCLAEELPLVTINRTVEQPGVCAVVNDDQRGIRMAVEHVVELGHRRIGHLGGPQELSTGFGRAEGFRAALRGAGIDLEPRRMVFADAYSRPAGRIAALELLGREPKLTAIVAANDLLALGAYDALRERGLRCPDNLSVVGYNDMPLMDLVDPPLTTVRIQHLVMGQQAARLLLDQMQGRSPAAYDVVLKPELVVRASTARVAREAAAA
jgi:LacI family transcriptional regulator